MTPVEQAAALVREKRFAVATIGTIVAERWRSDKTLPMPEDHREYLDAEEELNEAKIALEELVNNI